MIVRIFSRLESWSCSVQCDLSSVWSFVLHCSAFRTSLPRAALVVEEVVVAGMREEAMSAAADAPVGLAMSAVDTWGEAVLAVDTSAVDVLVADTWEVLGVLNTLAVFSR
ncbi:MAG: hypothetical protein AABP62_03985 [Planctomycetota bacterium]